MPRNLPQRRSIRLAGYDYSREGLYFVTICCQHKICRFGKKQNGEIALNGAGQMINTEWRNLKKRFPNIELHDYVIMPNHFHGIIEIIDVGMPLVGIRKENGQPQGIAPTLGKILGAFKSITTVGYIQGVLQSGWEPFDQQLWQHNYYEHIIRDERSHQNISDYIINNPYDWENDEYYI
jgi:REP element-mobilizing transposase RayT